MWTVWEKSGAGTRHAATKQPGRISSRDLSGWFSAVHVGILSIFLSLDLPHDTSQIYAGLIVDKDLRITIGNS